ncbi:peptidase M23 [Arthrobacter sp. PAMC 25486]|uniref:M23 family metallopeptidase n=1 Tax=Arthrobacter sp. PAMC 25486 TaxID=1494608 RepID=UPI00053632E6|nr:M23 family metallopeptidase [Arthrobacter sp. PAMC 25486]AIY00039.1 peptidase M23 [Arthrobacter sp. PAMC 25486]
MSAAVLLALPFTGKWLVQNSPLRRVPSHGTELLGSSWAIDFVGVDNAHWSAPLRDWRTLLATEPPERFFSFGRAILAPADGVVVAAHDGESDHSARRSQLALVAYMLGQAGRLHQGVAAVAGNYVILELNGTGVLKESGAFVALVHLRAGSLRVGVGETVVAGAQLAECGNSGNSTQPHVHLQAMDSADLSVARGLRVAFQEFREWSRGSRNSPAGKAGHTGIPAEGSIVEPLAPA